MNLFKYTINNSHSLNTKLLKIIDSKIGYIKKDKGEDVYTDFDKPIMDYGKEFISEIEPTLQTFLKTNCHNQINVGKAWFQSYTINQFHSWHTHQGCQFSAVYYIELPNKKNATEFYDVFNKKIIKPNVKEGDLLIFNSGILHRSPISKTNKRKTVISFNFDISSSVGVTNLI